MTPTGTPDPARIAAVYDVHGNPFALQAVLRDIRSAGVDAVVVGGDIAWGPFPRETVELIRRLNIDTIFVRGNADREVGTRAGTEAGLDEVGADINGWCADQLSDEQNRWLVDLDPSALLNIAGVGLTLFCHGSPRSDEEPLTMATPTERRDAALQGVEASTIVCGHTHVQFELQWDERRLVNPGSVGLPYQEEPGAYWALLGPGIELRRTTYDLDEAFRSMSQTDCPHVQMVFIDTLTQPPPQAKWIAEIEAAARSADFA